MTERTIFLQALERDSGAARTAYLAEACGTDTELRQRVEQLLQSHSDAGSFLGQPVLGSSVTSDVTPGGETETHSPDAAASAITLDFLTPSDKPGSLGRLDHYAVIDIVGRGGMGIVLRAFDEKLHRVVALKVMTRDIAGSAAARKRFSREAKAAAAVVHDHIVPIHAIEEPGPTPYLVMQFIEGHSLQQKIDTEGSLELKEILRIGMQIAAGLAAAHKQGLVHRDIKPSNILLENGVQRVKITDFGLARAVDDSSVSQSGIVAGTPQYMSPEQADGQPVDHRSDLFSLGSVLYAMCAGRPPFRAASTVATLKRVCEDTPRPIRELNPDMPEWLTEIIGRLHAKKPAERFQSAKEVAEELERHLAAVQKPDTAAPPVVATMPASEVKPWEERTVRIMVGALTVGGLVQLVLLAAWLTRGKLFGWAAGACAVAMGVLALYFAYYWLKLQMSRRTRKLSRLSAPQRKLIGVAIGLAIVVVIMLVATSPYLFSPEYVGQRQPGRHSERTSVRQLQQMIDLQIFNVDQVKRQVDAGVASPPELIAAEVELIEARIRLAEAITDKRELGLLWNQLVAKREEQLKSAEQLFAAGAIAEAQVNDAKKKIIEARIRAGDIDDKAQLQGVWVAVSGEREGRTLTAEQLKGMKIAFESGRVRIEMPGKVLDDANFKLDQTTKPKEIDIIGTRDQKGRYGIYRLDGDTLSICMGEENVRPKELQSNPGYPTRLALVFRRSHSPESAEELQRLVTLQEQTFEAVKQRMLAGAVSATALVDAEIELIEARVRLAEAQKRSDDVANLLGELVEKFEMQWNSAKSAKAAGIATQAEVDQAEKRFVEARLRLETYERGPSANHGVVIFQFEPGDYSNKIREFGVIVQVRDASGRVRKTVVKPGQKVSVARLPGELTLRVNEAESVELSREQISLSPKAEELVVLRRRAAKPSSASIDGRWLAVSAEYRGRQVPESEAKLQFPPEIEIKGIQFGITWGDRLHEGTLTIDPTKSPADIDFSGSVFDSKLRKAIYRLEGDRLTICLPFVGPSAPRPAEFRTDPQSENALLTYRRAK